jgi:hypothetical protein
MQDLARLQLSSRGGWAGAATARLSLPATSFLGRPTPARRRPSTPSPHGAPSMALRPTIQGWPSPSWTHTSAAVPLPHLRSRRSPLRRLRGRGATPPRCTTQAPRLAFLYQLSPASGCLASKHRPTVSHSCPVLPGADLAAAATIPRGASRAEAGQRAARAALAAERTLYGKLRLKTVKHSSISISKFV